MNYDKPSVALRLADELDKTLDFQTRAWSAAKELRRLSAINQELLDALRAIVKSLADQDDEGLIEHAQQIIDARAAIAKATEAA